MNIETIGLGAGSYPEAPEPKEKQYQFEFNAVVSGYGVVSAINEEKAQELIDINCYDEIIETYDLSIEEVTDIREV